MTPTKYFRIGLEALVKIGAKEVSLNNADLKMMLSILDDLDATKEACDQVLQAAQSVTPASMHFEFAKNIIRPLLPKVELGPKIPILADQPRKFLFHYDGGRVRATTTDGAVFSGEIESVYYKEKIVKLRKKKSSGPFNSEIFTLTTLGFEEIKTISMLGD